MNDQGRMVVWFSCGAASAVAAKVCVDAYAHRREVVVVNVDMDADEHPDNVRFLRDVERWIGKPITRIRNEKYSGIDDVFLKERYIAGATGAACTKRLKREVQKKFIRPGDVLVLGFTSDEMARADLLQSRTPDEQFWFVLVEHGITKEDCYRVLTAANIELPAMYRLGFDHNNCVGCVKGGMGYWNKIRRHFPEVYERRAKVQREIGAKLGGADGFFLDELDPEAGRDGKEPDIECGLFCGDYANIVPLTVKSIQNERQAS